MHDQYRSLAVFLPYFFTFAKILFKDHERSHKEIFFFENRNMNNLFSCILFSSCTYMYFSRDFTRALDNSKDASRACKKGKKKRLSVKSKKRWIRSKDLV